MEKNKTKRIEEEKKKKMMMKKKIKTKKMYRREIKQMNEET